MIATSLSLLFAVLCTEPQDTSELLPETPADWDYERIDFPLSFAPELKYDGFEELRFAPGMFNAESDTYFTYIFAIKIKNDITFDAGMLKTFLETYYRGLCRTVAQGTDFDIDVSKISAKVYPQKTKTEQVRHYRATLDSFDPFVTGKPLRLHLEMVVVDKGKADHRIFAAVCPQPEETAIWKQMKMFKRQFQKLATNPAKPSTSIPIKRGDDD